MAKRYIIITEEIRKRIEYWASRASSACECPYIDEMDERRHVWLAAFNRKQA